MTERLNLMVDEGIGELMTQLAGGERRRGQWLGDLVRAIHEQERQGLGSDLEAIRLGFAGLAGQHKSLDARLIKVEQQLAAENPLGGNGH